MKIKVEPVKEQCSFCMELMKRLNEDVQNLIVDYGTIRGHTQMEQDIIRLRRELMDLAARLKEYTYEY